MTDQEKTRVLCNHISTQRKTLTSKLQNTKLPSLLANICDCYFFVHYSFGFLLVVLPRWDLSWYPIPELPPLPEIMWSRGKSHFLTSFPKSPKFKSYNKCVRSPQDHSKVWWFTTTHSIQHRVILMAKVSYSERIQNKISAGRRSVNEVHGKSGTSFQSPLPVKSHRIC